jgi:hypothetical protein
MKCWNKRHKTTQKIKKKQIKTKMRVQKFKLDHKLRKWMREKEKVFYLF